MTEQQTAEKQRQEDQHRETIREYEECFLGSLLMLHTSEIPQLKIKAHCFSNSNNGRIFSMFFSQLRNGIEPNIQTLVSCQKQTTERKCDILEV